MNLALCETLDGILTRVEDDQRAPRTLGVVASVMWLGCIVVGAALWPDTLFTGGSRSWHRT